MRHVLDSIPGPVLEFNRQLEVTLANKEAHKRWASLEEGSFHHLLQTPDMDGDKSIVARTFEAKENLSGRLLGKEGVFSAKTNYINQNNQEKVVLLLQDITEHHDQLLQADKMISLGLLASGMAHEINNPNNSIMLNVGVLRKAWDSILPVLEEYYKENGELRVAGIDYEKMKKKIPSLFSGVLESSKKIQRIVGDLKQYSGKDSISLKEEVDMEQIVRSAISLTENMIHKATHNFKAAFQKDLPNVIGNAQNLEQVIINLIQNACQALKNQGQGIFITVTYCPQSHEIVTTIKDEGPGIPPKDLKLIKEPFFTTKRSTGGTGLGLYMSSKIVGDHGGTMDFSSNPARGTTVEVRLKTP